MAFEGVPPIIPPLGMFYLFDYNVMKAVDLAKPPPESMASVNADLSAANGVEGGERVAYAPTIVTDTTVRLAPIAPLRESSQSEPTGPGGEAVDGESHIDCTSLVQSKIATDGNSAFSSEPKPPIVDLHKGTSPEWDKYVLPEDGYSIEFPAEWDVDVVELDCGSLLTGRDPSGHSRWEIRRFRGTTTVLDLMQGRINSLETSGEGVVENSRQNSTPPPVSLRRVSDMSRTDTGLMRCSSCGGDGQEGNWLLRVETGPCVSGTG